MSESIPTPSSSDPQEDADIKLTAAQKARVERNRQRALLLRQSRLAKKPYSSSESKQKVTRTVDTGAGFFLEEEDEEETRSKKTEVKHPLGPVLETANDALVCEDCGKEFMDSWLLTTYNVNVCDVCKEDTEKHPLVTKSEVKDTYLLKDADLEVRDPPLKFIIRKNPRNPRWGDMKLYYGPQNKEECRSYFDLLQERLASPPMFTTLRLNTNKHSREEIHAIISQELQKVYMDRKWDPPQSFLHPELDDVLVIANRGPQPIKQVEKEVIIDQSCGMAVMRGADIFVQGILGAPTNMMSGDLVSVVVDLEGRVLKGDTQPLSGPRLHVGNGVAQFDRDTIFKSQPPPSGVGILMTEPLYKAPCLSDLRPDLIMAQNLPSIVCTRVLDPKPGERILDMCAAPGGKTMHIASRMQNKGEVIAIDRSDVKVEKIRSNLERWALTCVTCHACDALKVTVGQQGGEINFPEIPVEYFDRILLDVPCSALGQRPSIRNPVTLNSLKSYPGYQRKFIRKAVQLLRPGGVLVYSTCTITMEENEKQAVWMLENFPELILTAQHPHLGSRGRKCPGLSDDQRQMLQVFDPACDLSCDGSCDKMAAYNKDTIGFFIAKFTKIKK